MTKITE